MNDTASEGAKDWCVRGVGDEIAQNYFAMPSSSFFSKRTGTMIIPQGSVYRLTMTSFYLSVALVLISGTRVIASLAFGSTPESLAHKAALTFEGVPQHVEIKHLVGDRWLTTVQFRIDKLIKGPLASGDLVTVTSIDWTDRTDQMDLAGAVTKKRDVLVMATIAEHTFPETDGRYIFLGHFWNCPVIYSDEPVKWIYTEAGASIQAYDEVRRRIETQTAKEAELIRRYWRGTIIERQIEAKFGTDAQKQLYGGSAVRIIALEYKEP